MKSWKKLKFVIHLAKFDDSSLIGSCFRFHHLTNPQEESFTPAGVKHLNCISASEFISSQSETSIDNFIFYSISGFVSFLPLNRFYVFVYKRRSEKEFSFIRNCLFHNIDPESQNSYLVSFHEWERKGERQQRRNWNVNWSFSLETFRDLVRSRMFCVWDFSFERFNHWCFDLNRKEIFFL